jgi:SecD/SecF fusion protein
LKIKEIQGVTAEVNADSTSVAATTAAADTSASSESLLNEMNKTATDTSGVDNLADFKKEYPLFALLNPSTDQTGQLFPGPIIGMSHFKDTAQVNEYLNIPQVRSLFPQNMKFRCAMAAPRLPAM